MYSRNVISRIKDALEDTPVIFLRGARQIGKSTLVQHLVQNEGGIYLTLDDPALMESVTNDPVGFLAEYSDKAPVCIDEAQRAPALFPLLKARVDENRKPGSFLLTGSADVMMLPKVSESLAGRIEIITMWPLSQGELLGQHEDFIQVVFSGQPPRVTGKDDFKARIEAGGFPEAIRRKGRRRDDWFHSYATAVMQRDIRNLARIERVVEVPHILQLLASRNGGLLNYAGLARDAKMTETTIKRYLALLQTMFLFQPLPAWFSNVDKCLIKAPKVYLLDSGLAAFLTGGTKQPSDYGSLLETFIISELRKQASWSELSVELFHFRTASNQEVDIVLEDRQGRIVGIEIKSSATLRASDFSGLRALAELVGERFVQGIVLYQGEHSVPFGPGFRAVPIQALWQ